MELVNSRFQILDSPILAPGKCTVCGSSETESRKYIDFGFQLDWYGAVYLCTECVTEAASALGLQDVSANEKHVEDLNNSLSAGDGIIWGLKEEVNAARVLLRNCHCSDPDSGFVCIAPVSVGTEGESPASGDSSGDDESGSVEGTDDISEPSDIDDAPKPKRKRTTASDE